MAPSQIITLLSPIFVGLAGWLVTWMASNLPGHPHLDATGLAAIFIAASSWAALKLWGLINHQRATEVHAANQIALAASAGPLKPPAA